MLTAAGASLLAVAVIAPALGGLQHSSPSASGSSAIELVATLTVGKSPDGFAYNSFNNEMYVANGGGSSVYAFNATTNVLLNTIAVKSHPGTLLYDPANHDTYVADNGVSAVSIIPPSNAAPTTVTVGSEPYELLYDPLTTEVYATVYGASYLSAINSSTNAVTHIAGFTDATAMAYDPADQSVFVQNAGNSTVAVVNRHNHVTVWIAVNPIGVFGTDYPLSIAYDPANKTVWSLSYGSGYNQVDILNSTSWVTAFYVFGGASGGGPESIAYDSANSEMYVTDTIGNQVTVFNSKTYDEVNVGVDVDPTNVVYDPSNHEVYVSNYGENSVDAIAVSSANVLLTVVNVGANPDAIAVDSATSAIWVANIGGNTVSVVSG